MKINHNMPALRALRHLGKSEVLLSNSLHKLSSGNRINRSSDDAAGLAIAHKLKIQLNGLDQSGNNAWDGVSLIQTAEGALDEIHAMLQRMNELSVQAANGSYILEDRANIQKEISQLKDEIDRLADSMDFNGIKILNGDLDLLPMVSDKYKVKVESIHESVTAGRYDFTVNTVATKAKVTGGVINGNATKDGAFAINGQTFQFKKDESLDVVFRRLQHFADQMGITAGIDGGNIYLENREFGSKEIELKDNGTGSLGELGFAEGKVQGLDAKVTPKVAGMSFPVGATAIASGNEVTFQGADGFHLKVMLSEQVTAGEEFKIELLKEGPAILQIGANEGHTMQVRIPNVSTIGLGLKDVAVRTAEEAKSSISLIAEGIVLVSSIRSKLGAYQNRLEYSIANIETTGFNMTEAHSRIMHVDMSEEMTEYTKQNVIQQAATSLLAQANQKPQELLQLLR